MFGQVLFALLLSLSQNQVESCQSGCPSGQKCILDNCVLDIDCPETRKWGSGPPATCNPPSDPNNLPTSGLESWFTEEIFNDLFPKANIGWGPNTCFPYSYQSFIIASRYFPNFGMESPNNGYSVAENTRRDLAAFFSHVVQETGENDASLYSTLPSKVEADACFYRGGFFNWFEGGPRSGYLQPDAPGYQPEDGADCTSTGLYCASTPLVNYFYPCQGSGCYIGRGPLQLSWNYNYGQFNDWLKRQNINVDLLTNPNLVVSKTDPPLVLIASLWFYMTPQPPKPAMHDIVLGLWKPGATNIAAGYHGPIFGPTSLIINNECSGEDVGEPGGGGESRRIKAFKWFSQYFGFPLEDDHLLSCKDMPVKLSEIQHDLSYQFDWSTASQQAPCNCAPASYAGLIFYFQPGFYPQMFVDQNEANRLGCVDTVYDNPGLYGAAGSTCLNYPPASTTTTAATTTSTTITQSSTSTGTASTTSTTMQSSSTAPPTTFTSMTTTSPCNSVVVTVEMVTQWTNSNGQNTIEIGVTITNNGDSLLNDIQLQILPTSTEVMGFWGLNNQEGSYFSGLPAWQGGIAPGASYVNFGLNVVSNSPPNFVVVSPNGCVSTTVTTPTTSSGTSSPLTSTTTPPASTTTLEPSTTTSTTITSTPTPSTTLAPTSQIVIHSSVSSQWESNGKNHLQLVVCIKNNGESKVCDVVLKVQPPHTEVTSFWGMDYQSNGYVLPNWVPGIPQGEKYDGFGLIVISEHEPSFTVVSTTSCS